MTRCISTVVLVLATMTGCIHPPPPVTREIAVSSLPRHVINSFNAHFPDAEISRVTGYSFNGKIVSYDFEFSRRGEAVRMASITPKGEVTLYDKSAPVH